MYGCAVRGLRGKEDMLNSPLSGLLTGGSLAVRGGLRSAITGGVTCALVMLVIEGVGFGVSRLTANNLRLEWPGTPGPEA